MSEPGPAAPDMAAFRRAVQLRDRCRHAAVAEGAQRGMPLSPVQANIAYDAMAGLIRTDERGRLRNLIRDLTDADDCWFDHHGGCQARGYLSLKPGEKCPHAEAKELLGEKGSTDE